jgi:hypothetical protein
MLITATQNVVPTTITMHSMFRGDADIAVQKLQAKKAVETKHLELDPKLLKINTNLLVPLESQRVTKENWTIKRLEALGGLDMWAFGTLDVCLDPRDGVYYVWNGCGRLALAQLHGLEQVPCVVIEGPKEQAAFYFGYNQDSTQGRRTLSKEVLFVNRYYSGDSTAIDEADILNQLGLYIKGDTNFSVPQPTPDASVEIGYRAFAEAQKITQQNLNVQRQARDMVVSAWSNNPNGCKFINQDIYWALCQVLTTAPLARKGMLNTRLQQFLTYVATGQDQTSVKWKPKGLSGNSGISRILAVGLVKAFKDSTFTRGGDGSVLADKLFE